MSLVLLGILNQQLSGGGIVADPAMDFLETQTITTGPSSWSFTGLISAYGATYKHLQVRILTKPNDGLGRTMFMRFNSDTGTNYSYHSLTAFSPAGGGSEDATILGSLFPDSYTYQPIVIDINDPFVSSKNTTMQSILLRMQRAGSAAIQRMSGAWYNTNAVDSITISVTGGNLHGGIISLYGLKG